MYHITENDLKEKFFRVVFSLKTKSSLNESFDNSLTKDAATDEQKEFFEQGNVYETNNRKLNTVFAEKANSNCLVLMEDEKFPVSWK